MKIFGIGRNYLDHAKELKNDVPAEPMFFMMPDTALLTNNKPFYYPEFTKNLHYEVEIVVKISRVGKNISEKFAKRYYDEIALGIDLTARDLQEKCKQKGLPWEICKSFDNAAPISKFVKLSNYPNIQDIDFSLDINGKTVQKANTRDMIFGVDRLIAHISQFVTIKIGDLIYTGTPAGVGPLHIGDNLIGRIGDKKMMDFYIK
ncbi:MAG: 2-hydroxyhepta-2,4-diene-1,7-dioate isomerase [Bacteroidetes bacterium GWF2_38_335]|nr:MAG: 2-hydroxyhepta-2,4-diene-1,7-dioate isomerase [Bacteroidetes bacterium GWF2_38_335]OFY80967.1 MAG: 2-hydroxyhepta-2,4-diene-1,7-dioate isomerase [Bacteroidetes bacterium RIFOXYA12_FULL_38_20]HBS85096.1 2-hydroxyhepta-2,4-diene-1,7-dioate isomerase [Bacteroidales bacterium]